MSDSCAHTRLWLRQGPLGDLSLGRPSTSTEAQACLLVPVRSPPTLASNNMAVHAAKGGMMGAPPGTQPLLWRGGPYRVFLRRLPP